MNTYRIYTSQTPEWLVGLVLGLLLLGTAPGETCGQRSGFIFGIGAGSGVTSYTQTVHYPGQSFTSERVNRQTLMTHFKIGYAPTDVFHLYWMSKVSWFGLEDVDEGNVINISGIAGLGGTYFLEPQAPSLYLSGGIGYANWTTPFEQEAENSLGIGMVLGGGYEFAEHFTVDLDVMWGRPSSSDRGVDVSLNTASVKVALNFLLY